jgi:hypothetical protein
MSLIVMAFAGCQPTAETNRNENATAAASPPRETFDAAAIEAEVMKLERDWFKAGQTHDAELIKQIVADDAILVYPDGSTGNKAEELRLVETKAITVDSWEIPEAKVTVLSADSAFISGRSVVKNGKIKDANMPRPVDISGEYRFVDVYARRNGKWQVVASAAAKVQNPAPPAPPRPSPAASPSPPRP